MIDFAFCVIMITISSLSMPDHCSYQSILLFSDCGSDLLAQSLCYHIALFSNEQILIKLSALIRYVSRSFYCAVLIAAMSFSSFTKDASNSVMMVGFGSSVFVEHAKTTNMTNFGQNIPRITVEGNGTFMLPAGNLRTRNS